MGNVERSLAFPAIVAYRARVAMATQAPNSGPNMSSQLPVAVIGCGRMGRFHARVYSQMPAAKLVGVFDANRGAAASVANEYGCRAFGDLDELLPNVAAVTIAVPTEHHLAIADQCLRRRVACLIEKPLARTVEDCRRIVELSR